MTDRAQTEPGEDRCPWHDTNVENFGKNGKNGRLGNVIRDVKELTEDMEKVKAEQTRMQIKLAIITGGSSLAGGGIVAFVMKVFGG